MAYSEDVDRLFSWLKAPALHYREFAPQREVAEAVATWPVAYRAAVQSGVAAEQALPPQGDSIAKERLARDRMTLPTRPVQHLPSAEAAPYEPPPEPPVEAAPEANPQPGPSPGLGGEAAAERPAAPQQWASPERREAPPVAAGEPEMTGFEPPPRQPAPRPMPPQPRAGEPARYHPAARERTPLFAGEYRPRQHDGQRDDRVADRHDRSLNAVFSRLAGGRDRLPDPRARARTNPGLGPVFNRLR